MRNGERGPRRLLWSIGIVLILAVSAAGVGILHSGYDPFRKVLKGPPPAPAAPPASSHVAPLLSCGSGGLGQSFTCFLTECEFTSGLGPTFEAGAGCPLVGALSGLVAQFGSYAASDSGQAELQFQEDQAVLAQTIVAYTNGLVAASDSHMNSTLNAWAAMADAAAVSQIGNASFNPLLDMDASGVGFQFASLEQTYANALDGGFSKLNFADQQAYSPSGIYGSSCKYDLVLSTPQSAPNLGCLTSSTSYYSAIDGALETSSTNGTGLAFNQGGQAWILCSSATSAKLYDEAANTTITLNTNSSWLRVTAPQSAVYQFQLAGGGASCTVVGTGLAGLPVGASSPGTHLALVGCGSNSLAKCNPLDVNAHGANGGFTSDLTAAGSYFSEVQQTRSGSGTPLGPLNWNLSGARGFSAVVNNLVSAAETNAQAYWLFLRILGYTNPNQIPSNCLIPMPNQILPPQWDQGIGNLTVNQSLSLYLAWLNGLATFFNTPANSSNFCGGHPIFQVGFVPWNLNTEITGFALTLPIGSQALGTRSTWNVTNASHGPLNVGTQWHGTSSQPTPLVIWPLARTLNVVVGKVQEVPINDPLLAFVPNTGILYELFGNGTAVGGSGYSNGTQTSSAGAAIFISSCLVRNATGGYVNSPNGVCPLALSTIQNVTFNITNNNVVPPVGLGAACGQTFPVWAQLVTAFASFTGDSALGCLAAEALAAITLVVGVVLLAAFVVWVFKRN